MIQQKTIPLIVILGPTSSGKTALSLVLAKKYNGEIVSADSRQVYKRLDIGTGKATKRELKTIRHYLIDWKNPGKTITLSEYKKAADSAIHDIYKRGKIPFLVGGSPLYIQAVIDNYQIPSIPPQKKLRKKLDAMSTKALISLLQKKDPVMYKKIDTANRRRLIRALEVTLVSGKPFSSLQKKGEPLYNCLLIGLSVQKKQLYKKIDQRLGDRIRRGMIAEVRKLLDGGVSGAWLSSLGLEYRHTTNFLQTKSLRSKKNIDEYKLKLQYAIHDFARRQMVWFRRDPKIEWIKPSNVKYASFLVRNFLL